MGSFYSSCNEGPARARSLSPSKFKTGVRNKFLTLVNSPLILIPITATIRTRQVFFVITVLFLNIVLCKGKGRVGGGRGIWCRRVFEVITVLFKYCVLHKKGEEKLVKFLIGIWFIKR